MRNGIDNDRRSLLDENLKVSQYDSVIAIVREEKGDPPHVFLLTETMVGDDIVYDRFEFDGENFCYAQYFSNPSLALNTLQQKVLSEKIVVGKCWQIHVDDYDTLCRVFKDQKLVHAMEMCKVSPDEREAFFYRNSQEVYDEYKEMRLKQPFEWVIATLPKLAIKKWCKIYTMSELPCDLRIHQQNKDILFIRNKNDPGVHVYFVRQDTGGYDLENPIYIDDEDLKVTCKMKMAENRGINITRENMIISSSYDTIEKRGGFVKREITLPKNMDDISGELPSLGEYFCQQQLLYNYMLHPKDNYVTINYSVAVERLKRIGADKPLEQVVGRLNNKLGFFSMGVRDKINTIKQTASKHATNIISDSSGIKSIINALNVRRKNLLTYFFWSIVLFFRKDKLTSSCEYFLIELVKHDAASLIIDNNHLYLNFVNKYLNERIDVGVSSENLSREVTELCKTPRP